MRIKWIIIASVVLSGCYKDRTNYYADDTRQGLTIFSNTGNNIFTCYVNGWPWRTVNRITGGFLSGSESELAIYKVPVSNTDTMLVIKWDGFLQAHPENFGSIALYLKIPSGFSSGDLDTFQGQRFSIDSSRGYFTADINGYPVESGTGEIYFNRANYSGAQGSASVGELSGILEAAFPDFTITQGRFDDQLTSLQVPF